MDLNKAPLPGVAIELVDSDVTKWNVILDGPEGTPFIGGKFTVNLDFSEGYPFKPPKIKFVTKIYHPNVKGDTGEICTQAIDQAWVPTLNSKFIIQAIQTVIQTPNVESAQEMDIANEFKSNNASWAAKAAEWTASYAK
jgi:ubiquitin-protein ligase